MMVPVLKRFLGEQPEEFVVVGLVMQKTGADSRGEYQGFTLANDDTPIDFIPFFLISEQTLLN